MGGPAAGVLLRQIPDQDQILAMRTWLGAIARFHDTAADADLRDGWEFFLNWPKSLGDEPSEGACLGGIQMYLIDPEAEHNGASFRSPADWARLSKALGWVPACELSAWINCDRPRDHQTLGWFCAELASRFSGVIDLGGILSLPAREDWGRCSLAGDVLEVPYDLDAGRTASVHVVDVDFLLSWMLQKRFHMIK